MKIFLTGASGFVGKELIKYFRDYEFDSYKKDFSFNCNSDVFIHCAGKAHDLKNISSSKEYYEVNTDLTKKVFDAFLISKAKIFITLSSVKAVSDKLDSILTEEYIPNPATHYGKSKLLAENYILTKEIPIGKKVYILRPCLIHGPNNKGNLNLLYKFVSLGLPWPLGAFNNKRSFCSIENLCFAIKNLIEQVDIPSGVYNIADNESLSTNDLIKLIANVLNKKPVIFNIPKRIIYLIAILGDLLNLPLNSERLQKLTENYLVSNNKLIKAINKTLPLSSKEGLIKTIDSLKKSV